MLVHFIGAVPDPPPGVMARESNRFGVSGTDWWMPGGSNVEFPTARVHDGGRVGSSFESTSGVPAWGRELVEGMLPPEALLDATDISYNKGCYIGQEVISRIKSAGKVNRRLTRFTFASDAPVVPGPLVDSEGAVAGELTSVSPAVSDGVRHGLGYVKRGASVCFFKAADGPLYQVLVR